MRNLSLGLELSGINQRVTDFAFFWNGVGVTAFLGVEVSLEFGIAGMNAFENVVARKHCIIELDLEIALFEFTAYIQIRNSNAACDQVAQLGEHEFIFNRVFKTLHR